MARDKAMKDDQAMESVAAAPDDVAEMMKRLGAELVAVADDEVARKAKLREVEEFLGNLKVKDFPELAESPIIQQFASMIGGDLAPGQTKHRGTLAEATRDWTERALDEQFPKVTFIPMSTENITWNDVGPYHLEAGEEVTVPDPIYAEYKRIIEARKQARYNEAYMLGVPDKMPDPNWVSSEGARVRAMSFLGVRGAPSGHLSVGALAPNAPGEASGDE